MPGQLKFQSSNQPATLHVLSPEEAKLSNSSVEGDKEKVDEPEVKPVSPALRADVIQEEEQEEGEAVLDGFTVPVTPPAVTNVNRMNYSYNAG